MYAKFPLNNSGTYSWKSPKILPKILLELKEEKAEFDRLKKEHDLLVKESEGIEHKNAVMNSDGTVPDGYLRLEYEG